MARGKKVSIKGRGKGHMRKKGGRKHRGRKH